MTWCWSGFDCQYPKGNTLRWVSLIYILLEHHLFCTGVWIQMRQVASNLVFESFPINDFSFYSFLCSFSCFFSPFSLISSSSGLSVKGASQMTLVKKIFLPTQDTWWSQVWSLNWEDPRRRAWWPTPIWLPGESMDGGAWRATVLRVQRVNTRLKQLSTGQSFIGFDKVRKCFSLCESENKNVSQANVRVTKCFFHLNI